MQDTFKKLSREKQEKIISAAAKVFAEYGYHQANVAEICKEAGISNGALYKYFKDKESLFISTFEIGTNALRKHVFEKYLEGTGSIYVKLHRLLKGIVRFGEKDRREIAIYFELGSKSMNKFATVLSTKIEGMAREYYANLIEQGKQNNEIDKSINTEMAAYLIDNIINMFGFSLYSEHYNTRFSNYFRTKSKKISIEKKIQITLDLIKMILR
jgi:AcrR family transcriptional regulator